MGEYADEQIERDQRRMGAFGGYGRKSLPRNQPLLTRVTCPYCSQPAKLVDSSTIYNGKSYGMIWDCRPCDAYVGVHKNNDRNIPLGRLANKELRMHKRIAHATFDPLWEDGNMTRHEAYHLMQQLMGMTANEAHIGKFDVSDCKKLIEKLKERENDTDKLP